MLSSFINFSLVGPFVLHIVLELISKLQFNFQAILGPYMMLKKYQKKIIFLDLGDNPI